ncbi:hypothetical protein MPSEU_000545600 [Mayamaea pseudoterrestris]|nr:hypothetical protein MPSEU_000545600 [Mayamaea pseudoterrestris]
MSFYKSSLIRKQSPLRISKWNLILLCVASLGVGMLWAYQIFYTSYYKACQESLLEQEVSLMSSCKSKYESNNSIEGSGKQKQQVAADCSAASASISKALQESEQALFQLQGAVQRRSLSECMHKYGQPPYIVEVWFSVDGDEHVLPLEISQLESMPFTTETFLELVEYGLYTETFIGPQQQQSGASNDRNIIGGNPSDASTRIRTRLLRSYAELGFGTSATPFILDETTTGNSRSSSRKPCSEQYSFGFASSNAEFTIFANADESSNHHAARPVQCIGRVLLPQGQRAMNVLQTLRGPDAARIIEVRIRGLENEDEQQEQQEQREGGEL